MKILKNEFSDGGNGGNVAHSDQDVGPFDTDAMVLITAHGAGAYVSEHTSNAGILLTISSRGKTVLSDSFEAESSQMTFNTAATMMYVLGKGKAVKARADVAYMGTHDVKDAAVQLHIIAFEVDGGLLVDV